MHDAEAERYGWLGNKRSTTGDAFDSDGLQRHTHDDSHRKSTDGVGMFQQQIFGLEAAECGFGGGWNFLEVGNVLDKGPERRSTITNQRTDGMVGAADFFAVADSAGEYVVDLVDR